MRKLYGKGTALSNKKAVQRRAKARVKAYWNTYHCQRLRFTSENRMYAPHCKNRFCTYCCGIRKAELINKYLPVVKNWKDPHFVTLTIRAVPANRLSLMLEGIQKAFRQITGKNNKKAERGTGEKLMGLKSLECNFSPITKTYNPHLHLIVPSEKMAETLIEEWLQKWPTKQAGRRAQHYRNVQDREKDLVEMIKYEANIFTEPDGKKQKGKKGGAKIYARALDNIHAAMKGHQVFRSFGFRLPKQRSQRHSAV